MEIKFVLNGKKVSVDVVMFVKLIWSVEEPKLFWLKISKSPLFISISLPIIEASSGHFLYLYQYYSC